MHSLVRRYIKTAIGFLVAGLGIGLWIVVRRELWLLAPTQHTVSAHTHALLVGFVMMMILGVALWMFPRPGSAPTHYSPARAEAAYWLLATGTAVRMVAELARGGSMAMPLRWAVVVASTAQVAGLLLYFHAMWGRIRPAGSRQREAAGERF
jgi:heme/copper-type cytochrome/quinol oxidase subunit 1